MKPRSRIVTLALAALLNLILFRSRADAQGGIVTEPYWTFDAEARVEIVRTGDTDGDGRPEIFLVTDDHWLYALEADGSLAWSYELGAAITNLELNQPGPTGHAAAVVGLASGVVSALQPGHGEVWSYTAQGAINDLIVADLDGDDQSEILVATVEGVIHSLDAQGHPVWSYQIERPVQSLSAADLDGDQVPEIVVNPLRGSEIWVLDALGHLVWRWTAESELGLVDSGDLDGDGKAEIVHFSASWHVTAWSGDGQLLWHDQSVALNSAHDSPFPGQMALADLQGDGEMEVLIISWLRGLLHVLAADGSPLWQHTFGLTGVTCMLHPGDMDGDGQMEVLLAPSVLDPVRLLDSDGGLLAEYRAAAASGALAYSDLDGDGWSEVLVGTINGLQLFGASDQVTMGAIWQESLGSPPADVTLGDMDGDGLDEVIAGTQDGRVVFLSYNGEMVADVAIQAPVVAIASGDLDGDGRDEVAAGTWGGAGSGGGQVQLLAGGRRLWSVPAGVYVTDVAIRDPGGDGRPEIYLAAGLESGASAVIALDGDGQLEWQREIPDQITTIGGMDDYLLAGTPSGRVFILNGNGAPGGELVLDSAVTALDGPLAATAGGQIYQLAIAPSPNAVPIYLSSERVGGTAAVADAYATFVIEEERVNLVTVPTSGNPSLLWETELDDPVTALEIGDLNGDGQMELAAGTRRGRVILFGHLLNQPPLLTGQAFLEVGSGYSYSVDVNDPDRDTVQVTLEIWDPSEASWQADQKLVVEDGVGLLNWSVPAIFDTWDSGRDSKFRFVYADGKSEAVTGETLGPFSIPTTPWYAYYGLRVGGGALVVMALALAALYLRRQRAHRRSPAGRAEALLGELQAEPNSALQRLHTVACDQAELLNYLPARARQAGEETLAELSENFHLVLNRPEVAHEGLRAIVRAISGSSDRPLQAEMGNGLARLFSLCSQALDANTVSRVVVLGGALSSAGEIIDQPDSSLAPAASALVDLGGVTQTLRNYERVETIEDKVAYLAQAIETLGRLERKFRRSLPQPEQTILVRAATNWLAMTASLLQDLQGRALLKAALKTHQVLARDQVDLALELTNSGRSPASNITVTLLPGPDYSVVQGCQELEILPAGRSELVELTVAVKPAIDHFRAEFAIEFDDREANGKHSAYADQVLLLKPAGAFRPVPSPYAPGTPLQPNSSIFFGRQDLFQFIGENVGSVSRQNILVLVGQRRVGKTSFLRQLSTHLGDTYLPIYLDGQSLGIDPGMANFFYDLALYIVDALSERSIEMEEPSAEDFVERPTGFFKQTFLPRVFETIGDRRLLLLFDEFEELEMRVSSGKLEPSIFAFFRHLMQHEGRLGFVFVGTHRLEELTADYWSILFNIALYKRVSFLDPQAARALIVEPVAAYNLLYDDLALEKILRVTAGHPYFIQLICHALVNRANRLARGYLTIQDVNDVLGEMIEMGEAHFAFLWEQSSPEERLALTGLMRLEARTPAATTAQLTELLNERGVVLGVPETQKALRRLVDREILREIDGQPARYCYRVDLVRQWVECHRPLGVVIEEVG